MSGERSGRYLKELSRLSYIIQECDKCGGTGLSKEGLLSEARVTKASLKDLRKAELRSSSRTQRAQQEWVKKNKENPRNPGFGLCACKRKSEALREIIIADIPRKFHTIVPADLVPRNITVLGVQKMPMQKFIKWYTNKFDEAKKNAMGLNIYGKYGRGKTFATQYICTQLAKHRYSVHHIPFFQLLDLVRYPDKQLDFLREILEVDFLVVDDIGAEHASRRGFCGEVAYSLRRRIAKKRPTCFVFDEGVQKPDEILGVYGAPFSAVCRERNMNLVLAKRVIDSATSDRFVKRFFQGIT